MRFPRGAVSAAVMSVCVGLAACGAPAGALVTRCVTEALAIGDPANCQVSAERLVEPQAASFTFATAWSRVEITAELRVASGAATVAIDTLPERTWPLRPGTTTTIRVTVPFDRGLSGVMLRVRPDGGAVEGLDGTLRYRGLPAE